MCSLKTSAPVCFYLPFSSDFLNPRASFHNLDLPRDLPKDLVILHITLNLAGLNFPQKALGVHS